MRAMRQLTIQPVLNGFIVHAGCQMLVYKDMDSLSKDLVTYHKDPVEFEKYIVKHAVNPTITEDAIAPVACDPPTLRDARISERLRTTAANHEANYGVGTTATPFD